MNAKFDSLPWHDAELKELRVDRRQAGKRDEVHVRVAWPQGGEAALVFHECYALIANMNFGIIATERIGSATAVTDDQDLISIQERWKALGVSLEDLRCYQFELSSTGSSLRVYARLFNVLPVENQ